MKTVTVETFEFNELSDKAKQTAICRFREKYLDLSYLWKEGESTAKSFCDVFNVSTKKGSWLEPDLDYLEDDILEMSGQLLKEAIIENVPARYLKRDDYLLTGMCYDADMLSPIWDFMDSPSDGVTYEELITDCFYQLEQVLKADDEYQHSDEAISETIEANAYQFTKDGNFYF